MAANFASFTITQPFLGAPLQFHPALGSQELDQLIDAFVTGAASKKDKLSEVTIDFYNNATVDLNTGALVRRYDVVLSPWQSFEQSPISQSSGFSPPIFTPSPASSATFGDSGYGSISMTPPNRNRAARVSKKPGKKDTKKAAEVRLPGFSIMTKDGVDVTSSAGRGTKTKEQREHAHLMRIMKACDDCKRKKVRCDPSHRRSRNDMSRSSTSTKSSSSSSRVNPSPTVSVPSLSTYDSLPSYGTSAIDDFVLFPEDTVGSWNPADMSLSFDQGADLGQFNFDINDVDSNDLANQSFDFSFEPSPNFQPYTPLTNDQFGLDQWAGAWGGQSTTQTRPHHSASNQDSGQLDSSWYPSGSLDDSPVSPRTNVPGPNGMPNGSLGHSQLPLDSSFSGTSQEVSSLEWSVHDSSSFANISPHANQDLSAPEEGSNRKERRSRKRGFSKEAVQQLVDSVPSRHASETQTDRSSAPLSVYEPAFSDSPSEGYGQTLSPTSSSSSSMSISGIERTYAEVQESLHIFQSSPAHDKSLSGELLRLRETIDLVSSGNKDGMALGVTATVESILDDLNSQLQVLPTNVIQQRHDQLDPETQQEYIRQCQVTARRLVRSLCATISSLQAQNPSSYPTNNTIVIDSGRDIQLPVSPSGRHNHVNRDYQIPGTGEQMQVGSGIGSEKSYSQSSTHISSGSRYGVILREDGVSTNLMLADAAYEGAYAIGFGNAVSTIRKSPRYFLVEKENVFDLRRQSPSSASYYLSDATEMVASGHPLSTRSDFAQENARAATTAPITVANIAPSQQPHDDQSRSMFSENSQQMSTSPVQVMLARADGSSRSASLPHGIEASSRSAIPRPVLEQHDFVIASDSPRAPVPAGGFDMKYSMLVALALSASLVALNILQATQSGIMKNVIPFLLTLPLLAVAFPRQFSTALPPIIPLVAFTGCLALSLMSINVRDICTQWIGNNPFKLLLCCAIVAQPPSSLWKNMTGLWSLMPMAAAATLLHFSPEASSVKSTSHQSLSKGIQGRNIASLLELLSPVWVV